jgi:dihydrofolate reductase
MRRLILQTGISIDGYVAALDRSHPWGDGSEDEAVKRWILDSVWAAGAHLMGRVTYEEMAAFWPTSTSDYARPMNEIPKVVFSTYTTGVAIHVYRPRSTPADQPVDPDQPKQVG